jgi:hypothetical protein
VQWGLEVVATLPNCGGCLEHELPIIVEHNLENRSWEAFKVLSCSADKQNWCPFFESNPFLTLQVRTPEPASSIRQIQLSAQPSQLHSHQNNLSPSGHTSNLKGTLFCAIAATAVRRVVCIARTAARPRVVAVAATGGLIVIPTRA